MVETFDRRLISIFDTEPTSHLLKEALRDIIKLSGVLSELREYFEEPIKVLQILKVIHLINEAALGLEEPLEDRDALYYRYRNRNGSDPEISLDKILNVLEKFNWIVRTKHRITMMDVGKRMMDMLVRLANDSLAYYMQDEVARSLFQAQRDADLSEAYDDKGISGGNRLASMIRNVEEAVAKLKERQLEFLADRHALPQVQIIVELMNELNARLNERMNKYQTFEEGMKLAPLLKKGTDIMFEGTQISLGTLNKILKFAHLQKTEVGEDINPLLFRNFIIHSFYKRMDTDLPNGTEILSFMEQNRAESERLDGLWIPVKFASPIDYSQIAATVDYLEHYTPSTESVEERLDHTFEPITEWTEEEMNEQLGNLQWQMTKMQICTEDVERVLEQKEAVGLEELVWEAGSERWADALNALLAVSALISNKRAVMEKTNSTEMTEKYNELEWEFADEQDRRNKVHRADGRED
ncbi:hypothetical protein [Brevibacillus parabrevis]|uniref:hypothetical protein n=1 Tax=Brevibacillus parabrevis TaxID=54914 RepID=UPI000A74F38E